MLVVAIMTDKLTQEPPHVNQQESGLPFVMDAQTVRSADPLTLSASEVEIDLADSIVAMVAVLFRRPFDPARATSLHTGLATYGAAG